MAKRKASIADCHSILLQSIYDAISDPHCFYRYHIADKEKDEEGNVHALLREQIAEKIDLKAVKECIDILQSIQKYNEEGEDGRYGVVILQDTASLTENEKENT